MHILKLFATWLLPLALYACAAGPRFDSSGIDPGLTPTRASQQMESLRGQRVLWGGVVIATSNLADATQIEVLGYPLESNQRPDIGASPQGRFLIHREGYLEPTDYAQGRVVTVVGRLREVRPGRIGETDYLYPVVEADQIHLWPRDSGRPATRFNFGVGVIFNR